MGDQGHRFRHLFQPLQVGRTTLRSRVTIPGHQPRLAPATCAATPVSSTKRSSTATGYPPAGPTPS
jgi:2,4-dienoyl-CoA reductase-like NADH-dependent reductase (Old Yellow Enzyme family)